MKILDKHITRQIWVPSLLALTVVCVIAIASEIQDYLSRLPIDQVTFGDISKLSFLLVPTLIVFVVPIMYLLGIMLSFGRLSQYGEIIAMKAAGIPLKRVIFPVIVAGALLSLTCFLIQDRLQPWAVHRINRLMNDVPLRVTMNVLTPGVMHDFRGWNVYIGSKSPDSSILYDVDIMQKDPDGITVYSASSAQHVKVGDTSKIVMGQCYIIPPAGKDGQGRTLGRFDEFTMYVPKLPSKELSEKNHAMTLTQLLAKEKVMADQLSESTSARSKNKLRSLRRDIAERTSFPFACLVVTLVAAPLGVRAKRSGRSYSFSVGAAIIIVYYVLQMAMEPTSLHTLPTMLLRAWIPNVVLMTAGFFLIWRVDQT